MIGSIRAGSSNFTARYDLQSLDGKVARPGSKGKLSSFGRSPENSHVLKTRTEHALFRAKTVFYIITISYLPPKVCVIPATLAVL